MEERAFLCVSYNLLMLWHDGFRKSVTPVRWSITNVTRLKTLTPYTVVQEVTRVSQPYSDESHCFAGAMTKCGGPDIYSRFCISRHVCSKTGSTVPSLCYARTSPLLDWGTGIIVQMVTVLPTAETAHSSFVADVPDLLMWKSKAKLRPAVSISLSKQQFVVTRTIRHTDTNRIIWQIGCNHTFCQKSFLSL